MKKLYDNKIIIRKMVELYAANPEIKHSEVCEKVGISLQTGKKIRNRSFWADVYSYFMVNHQQDVLQVLNATVKEAKRGNVSAQKLVLQHAGRLVKSIQVSQVKSPMEIFLESKGLSDHVSAIESGDNPIDLDHETEEDIKLSYEDVKKNKWLQRRRALYKWTKRAEAVNIEPMKAKRPSKIERKRWEDSIIDAENRMRN